MLVGCRVDGGEGAGWRWQGGGTAPPGSQDGCQDLAGVREKVWMVMDGSCVTHITGGMEMSLYRLIIYLQHENC